MQMLELLLLILASFRLTHLIVFDGITEPIREFLANRPFLGPLVQCHWCMGVWVSGFLLLLHFLWPPVGNVLILLLAVAGGQALLESWIDAE
ncbi:MAG: DUF1360 domain-containing protein [Mycobacterium leprae]